MINGYQNEEELIRNMTDAGCEEDTISGILICLEQGEKDQALLLLQKQRDTLLNRIHRNQSCIRYLDDILCMMRKECAESQSI